MNTLYPIFLKLENEHVLVVGGGKVAEQKVKGLLEVNAKVTVIAPHVTPRIEAYAYENKLAVKFREYQQGDVDKFLLVFAATNNPNVHQDIFADATSRNIPVNVVDVPDLCNFYLASIFHNGELKVAVSTNGKSPALGKIIRDRIAVEFGKGYPELLDTLGEIRPSIHSIYSDPEKRKEALEKIVADELKKREGSSISLSNGQITPLHSVGTPTLVNESGKVVLVGAGPGDPELISVKGLRAIQSADVIAYDALVSPDLLFSAPSHCEKIFVGKCSGGHYVLQEETNKILIAKAKEGKKVVRLKGGDPFVFGRGGEELQALRSEGIDVEIIPGITAGIGIPTMLGIPLTHRGVASSVVFVTGTEVSNKEKDTDWQHISAVDTIVVYMGIKKMPEIVAKLLVAGRPLTTPVAVVFGGTTSKQIVIEGQLQNIVEKLQQIDTSSAGIIIIGETVNYLRSELSSQKLIQESIVVK